MNARTCRWNWKTWREHTLSFSSDQKALYMDVLQECFIQGALLERDVEDVLGGEYETIWPLLRDLFTYRKGYYAAKVFNLTRLDEDPNIPFEEFWLVYPRKVNKVGAEKSWLRLNDDEREIVMNKMPAFKAAAEMKKSVGEGEFIPHATTYLNQKRFLEEAENPVEPMIEDRIVHPELLQKYNSFWDR